MAATAVFAFTAADIIAAWIELAAHRLVGCHIIHADHNKGAGAPAEVAPT